MRALKSWGIEMTVEEVMKEVRADKNFYANSGGGITISGGEIAVQWEFAVEILKQCKAEGIHTCAESSMMASSEIIRAFFDVTDLFITDIKHMDTEEHKKWCGAGNEQILSNIKMTVQAGIPLVIRVPVIPGVNDSEDNIHATSEFIVNDLENRVAQVQLLVYLKMGTEKYDSLNQDYPMGSDWNPAERAQHDPWIEHLAEIMRFYGIRAYSGVATTIEGYGIEDLQASH